MPIGPVNAHGLVGEGVAEEHRLEPGPGSVRRVIEARQEAIAPTEDDGNAARDRVLDDLWRAHLLMIPARARREEYLFAEEGQRSRGSGARPVARLGRRVVALPRRMESETNQARVERLVRQYAQTVPGTGPLGPNLNLREQLGIESLALVSLVVRLGDELGVDIVESGVELGGAKTVADLVKVADALARS